jgi:hypothetical protein
MENRALAIEIVKEMVENGYHLFGETPEHFVDRLDITPERAERFRENFLKWKAEQTA